MSFAAAYAVSHLPVTPTPKALVRENALLLTAGHRRAAVQQAVGEPLNAANDCDHLRIGFERIEMSVKCIFDNLAEVKHIIGSGSLDDRDRRREVRMLPVTGSGDGRFKFDGGELSEAVGLVFDGHGENFGMFDEVAFLVRRWRINGASRRLVGELSAVVEQIEVFDHQLHNFRVVAYIRAVVAILCCC